MAGPLFSQILNEFTYDFNPCKHESTIIIVSQVFSKFYYFVIVPIKNIFIGEKSYVQ
jgi:hypothetical protein